ncbi:MAG TPA: DUF4105 domain-containing protein [Cyclobacteriaceae bacterium]|nr:DUF4105 domain-containing protein [Cyclobacteriaceae bacterium]
MRKILILSLILISLYGYSQDVSLTDSAQVSIITCGPYKKELYAAFGHSAIRVYDPVLKIDYAYNYGVFDFDQPNFYLNFARGYLYYKLGVYPYPLFRDYYISYNRFVHEQILELTAEQKQKVFDYLQWNARPENQTYRYDYFYNNCATKIRDVLAEVLQGQIKFDGSFIKTDYTIRELTDLYLSPQPWGDLGIDICLGLPMDKTAIPYEYMFLPDYIESSFDHASLSSHPIVKQKISVYEEIPEGIPFSFIHPWIVFGVFLLVTAGLTYYDWKRKTLSKWFDIIVFSVVGWIGVLLLLLWTATDHQAAAKNFNLLWALPLHAIAGIILLKKSPQLWLVKYFSGVAILLVATLAFWFLLPQQLNIFLIPIVIALIIRSWAISKLLVK